MVAAAMDKHVKEVLLGTAVLIIAFAVQVPLTVVMGVSRGLGVVESIHEGGEGYEVGKFTHLSWTRRC